jgi:chromosome segregation ATPase
MPDVLIKNSLKDQLNYIEERTRIYENYRAIREDMFQKLKGNISDTLFSANRKIAMLNSTVSGLKQTIDSLNSTLVTTNTRLENITRTKNSISVLGLEVNKVTYNAIMWLIVIGLAAILALGFLVFKRNLSFIHNIKNELSELKDEFQTYRKTTREAREKMSMDHFNEIKRMKGGG